MAAFTHQHTRTPVSVCECVCSMDGCIHSTHAHDQILYTLLSRIPKHTHARTPTHESTPLHTTRCCRCWITDLDSNQHTHPCTLEPLLNVYACVATTTATMRRDDHLLILCTHTHTQKDVSVCMCIALYKRLLLVLYVC